jgi:hypothetical protein
MDRPLRWVVGLLVAAAVWIALGQPEWSWQVACAALLLAAGLLWLLVRTGRGNTGIRLAAPQCAARRRFRRR